jgi:monoterpene epsilon-lactone hydrolase
VFALDYRLMPEHRRIDGIEDCRRAYRWILENGPEGLSKASAFIVVAGDSAGGNLTLSLLSWVRDEGLRRPDAGSRCRRRRTRCSTRRACARTLPRTRCWDRPLASWPEVPQPLLLWSSWFTRACCRLIRVSRRCAVPSRTCRRAGAGQRFGDAPRRCASLRGQGAGGGVAGDAADLAEHVHVWQMFTELPEAEEAYANVAEFLGSVEGAGPRLSDAA